MTPGIYIICIDLPDGNFSALRTMISDFFLLKLTILSMANRMAGTIKQAKNNGFWTIHDAPCTIVSTYITTISLWVSQNPLKINRRAVWVANTYIIQMIVTSKTPVKPKIKHVQNLVPSQESEWSDICVRIPIYQVRKVSGLTYVLGYQFTKSGK